MKRWRIIFLIIAVLFSGGILYYVLNKRPPVETKFVQNVREGSSKEFELDSQDGGDTQVGEITQEKNIDIKK